VLAIPLNSLVDSSGISILSAASTVRLMPPVARMKKARKMVLIGSNYSHILIKGTTGYLIYGVLLL
jgi:hypothetical protein